MKNTLKTIKNSKKQEPQPHYYDGAKNAVCGNKIKIQ